MIISYSKDQRRNFGKLTLRVFLGLCLSFFFFPNTYGQKGIEIGGSGESRRINNTPQIPNWDFEKWDSNGEPWGWNGALSSTFGNSPSGIERKANLQVWSESTRPGSKGNSSVRIEATQSTFTSYRSVLPWAFTWASKAIFGTLTTGALFGYPNQDKDISDSRTCAWTDRGNSALNVAFSGRPTKFIAWVKASANGGRLGSIHVYLHGASNLEDRNPHGFANDSRVAQGIATIPYNGGNWQRIEIPLNYLNNNAITNALVSFHTGPNMKTISEGDQLLVDDAIFYYEPSVSVKSITTKCILKNSESHVQLRVAYQLDGTISPMLEDLTENEVIAEISDENGSFDNAREIGRLTSITSDTVVGTIAFNDLLDGGSYKVRLRTTNLIRQSAPFNFTYGRCYNVKVNVLDLAGNLAPSKGSIDGAPTDFLDLNKVIHLTATATFGNHFLYWKEGDNVGSSNPKYDITITGDRTLNAVFDTNTYTHQVSSLRYGTAVFSDNGAQSITRIHNEPAPLRATADLGYHFVDYYDPATSTSRSSDPNYVLVASAPTSLVARFDTNQYLVQTAVNNPDYGTSSILDASADGLYKHFLPVHVVATPKSYCDFQLWTNAAGDTVGYSADTSFTTTGAQTYTAVFVEQHYTLTASISPATAGTLAGDDGSGEAPSETLSRLFSAYPLRTFVLTSYPNPGYTFKHWIRQSDLTTLSETSFTAINNEHFSANEHYTALYDTTQYAISTAANDSRWGSTQIEPASDNGHYKHFTTIRLKASAAPYCEFLNWEDENQNPISLDPEFDLLVAKTGSYTAIFDVLSYQVVITRNNEAFGQVSGAGTYSAFDQQSIVATATPTLGYHFEGWLWQRSPNDTTITDANWTLVDNGHLTQSYALEARFAINTYQVAATPSHGRVEGLGTYEHGQRVTLKAIPDSGYAFLGWFDAADQALSTLADTSFTCTASATLYPKFHLLRYLITSSVSAAGGGSITPVLTNELKNHFDQVHFTATPANDHEFRGWWEGNTLVCSEPDFRFDVDRSRTIQAAFSFFRKTLSLSQNLPEAASLQGGGLYEHGTEVKAFAKINYGFDFLGWFENGTLVHSDTAYAFALTASRNLEARFQRHPFHQILQAKTPGGCLSFGGAACYATRYDSLVSFEQPLFVKATANEHFLFSHWESTHGDTLSFAPYFDLKATRDTHFIGVFKPVTYELTAILNPIDAGTVTGTGILPYGSTATLEATANYGYVFHAWLLQGSPVASQAVLNFPVGGNVLLTAQFKPLPFLIEGFAFPAHAGTVTGSGPYDYRSNALLTAQAGPDYQFLAWVHRHDGLVDTVSHRLSFLPVISGNAQYEALFIPANRQVTADIYPPDGGRVEGLGAHRLFGPVTLQAVPNPGYEFVAWRTDEINESDPSLTLTLFSDTLLRAYFEPLTYYVEARSSNTAMGITAGSESYPAGYLSSFEALPEEHAIFTHWSSPEGLYLGDENPFYWLVQGNATLIANFAWKPYQVSCRSAEALAGKVKGSQGSFLYGDSLRFEANAENGYRFIGWQANGQTVSTANPYLCLTEKNLDLVALFEGRKYALAHRALPLAGGQVSVPDSGRFASTVELIARPAVGYTFVAWIDGYKENNPNVDLSTQKILSYESPYLHTVGGAMHLTALFQPSWLTIEGQAEPREGGYVSGSDLYTYGEPYQLEAIAYPGYRFSGWLTEDQQAASMPSKFRDTARKDRHLIARFEVENYPIVLEPKPFDGGTVDGAGTYEPQASVGISAQAHYGYQFSGWWNGKRLVSEDSAFTFPATEALTLSAHFSPLNFEITTSSSEGGNARGGGSYPFASQQILTATAIPGYQFMGWMVNDSLVGNTEALAIRIDGPAHYEAQFVKASYKVLVVAIPEEAGETRGSGNYPFGDQMTCMAEAATHYAFSHWIVDGKYVSEKSPILAQVVGGNHVVEAHFVIEQFPVEIKINLANAGTISGNGLYFDADTATLRAQANLGFTFSYWTLDGTIVSSDTVYAYRVSRPSAFVAHFSPCLYRINLSCNPPQGGSVFGNGTYRYLDSLLIQANGANGYTFVNWSLNGNVLSTKALYSFRCSGSMNIVANFASGAFEIQASAYPSDAGSTTGSGRFDKGKNILLEAIPKENRCFKEWREGTQVISTQNPLAITVSRNLNLTAVFVNDDGTTPPAPQQTLRVYPNPFANELHVINSTVSGRFQLFDFIGRVFLDIEIQNEHTVIDVSPLNPGTYFYKFDGNFDKKTSRGKLVKP